MAPLDQKTRNRLPDSAFAYIDSRGRRRLPINDEAHVRNALARFNQTVFEDEEARNRALTRLLKAAKKHGIVPVGFMTGQLRAHAAAVQLPSGVVTFLLTDIEDSTGLLRQLGDRYAAFQADLRRFLRTAVRASGGREVDVRADELFAVFERPVAATRAWPDDLAVRFRVGLHTGEPALAETGYVGLAVHTAARVCSAGHGGQILLSAAAREALEAGALSEPGIRFRDLGLYQLQGLPAGQALFQVEARDLLGDFPPLRAPVYT
jgi:class 3 adenylate cyclase